MKSVISSCALQRVFYCLVMATALTAAACGQSPPGGAEDDQGDVEGDIDGEVDIDIDGAAGVTQPPALPAQTPAQPPSTSPVVSRPPVCELPIPEGSPSTSRLPGCGLCGDGFCQLPEDAFNCPVDCRFVPEPAYCGDGLCNGDDTTANCPQDCGTRCGDGVCNGAETSGSCSLDCALPQDPAFQETVLQDGGTWQIKNRNGSALDEATGQMRAFNETYWVIQPAGIASAPISPTVKQELMAEAGDPTTVLTLSATILQEIDQSVAQGYLTPALAAIAQPDDGGGPLPLAGPLPKGFGKEGAGGGEWHVLGCSNQVINKAKSFNVTTPINLSTNPGGALQGTLTSSGTIQANATGEIQIALKRAKVLWWCIPYGVKLDYARAYGNAYVTHGSSITGTVNYSKSWEWELAKISLFSLNFWLGPIPVHIGFNLPINLGLDLQASASGTVTYTGSQSASGSFNYSCTLGGCSGSASYSQYNPVSPQVGTAGVGGRIQPNLWVQVAVRAYLYDEWFAYAQIGVRPYLRGDLWGYYGNNCGDGNGDGLFETVDALALDLDLQVHLTAAARAFGASPTQWNDLWHTPRYHLGYWDLIGSEALQPMLGGSSTATPNLAQTYTAKMRPCYPWTDNVSYNLNWGDSTTSSLSGAPQTATGASHAWSTSGAKPISLTALSDAHGRVFNQPTSRTINVTGGTWTSWLNRDLPSGDGDYETRPDFSPPVCANPIGIQCQTTAGVDWTMTGEVYSCTPASGGVCVNANQPDRSCMDYQVRFLCP